MPGYDPSCRRWVADGHQTGRRCSVQGGVAIGRLVTPFTRRSLSRRVVYAARPGRGHASRSISSREPAMLANSLRAARERSRPEALGNVPSISEPFRYLPPGDGDLMIGAGQRPRFARARGRDRRCELANDVRFSTTSSASRIVTTFAACSRPRLKRERALSGATALLEPVCPRGRCRHRRGILARRALGLEPWTHRRRAHRHLPGQPVPNAATVRRAAPDLDEHGADSCASRASPV